MGLGLQETVPGGAEGEALLAPVLTQRYPLPRARVGLVSPMRSRRVSLLAQLKTCEDRCSHHTHNIQSDLHLALNHLENA